MINQKEIEEKLYKFLPEEVGYNKSVLEAMNYAFRAGGKRIRPLLMYLTNRMFGGNGNVIEYFMAAIEMIHTYSLIHDDLPALDNDELRRGLPTVHVKFGEDIAILAGDALLNYAFEVAIESLHNNAGDVSIEKALKILSKKPGIYGMIGGQTADVVLTGQVINKEQLEYIYKNKTSALIECSMMIGASLADVDEEIVALIEEVAFLVGMAFQVQDDILDIEGDESVIGKPINSDDKNGKYTYATIFGIDNAKEYVKNASNEAIDKLEQIKQVKTLNINEEYYNELIKLINLLINRDK